MQDMDTSNGRLLGVYSAYRRKSDNCAVTLPQDYLATMGLGSGAKFLAYIQKDGGILYVPQKGKEND